MYEDRIAPLGGDGPGRAGATPPTDHVMRYLAGLDAERARLDIKTMALEGHEPLWSMGDDTPTPGRGRLDRPVADHLRQAFAQVTNPAIDPERERVVMDLRVELGRRPALLGGPPRGAADPSPPAADRGRPGGSARGDGARAGPRSGRSMRPGIPADGPEGLAAALDRLAGDAVAAARGDDGPPRPDRRRAGRSTACRSRRSWPPAPSTPR